MITREQSNQRYADIYERLKGTEEWSAVARRLCKHDLFFLMTWALGRTDVNHDWLYERCREVQDDPDGRLDLWSRFHYKALELTTLVPTPVGWRMHGELKEGDRVFGSDGKQCSVVATTEVFYHADCYKVKFDKGQEIVASGDHLWTVEIHSKKRVNGNQREGRRQVVVNTRELMEQVDRSVSTTTRVLPSVSLCDPVEYDPMFLLPIDPYVLGAWLGDGTSSSGAITNADEEVFKGISEVYNLGHDMTPDKTAQYRSIRELSSKLRNLGVLNNKHIPELYQRASIHDRWQLLRGLMDTDGTCDTRGTATFASKWYHLAHDVFLLLTGLGLKAGLRSTTTTYNGKPYVSYQVSFQAREDGEDIFKIKRKQDRATTGKKSRSSRHGIISVEPVDSVPCSCIQVDSPDGCYLVGEHYVKTHNSSIITMGKTIQDILVDQDIAIVLLSYNRPTAKTFLSAIKREFEMNEMLKDLFPDILFQDPQGEAQKWSEDAFIVRRTVNKKEATVEAYGLVDGQPTGRHYDLMVYDDVVTLEAVTTPEMIRKVTEAWEMSRNLQRVDGKTRTRYVGTRYSLNDTYRAIMDRKAAIPRIHGPTTDGSKEIREDNCALMPYQSLIELQRDTKGKTFQCQMFQDPLADEAIRFQEEWLRFWKAENTANMNVYIFVDPASKKKKKSDYTTMWVMGIGHDDNWYAVDVLRDKMGLTERAEALFDLHKRYRPIGVGYEEYGMQADIEHMKDKMERENYRFDITALGGKLAKEDRIGELEPLFRNYRIYLPEHCFHRTVEGPVVDMTKVFIEEEYSMYPNVSHDDMLDSLARIKDPMMNVIKPSASFAVGFQPNRSQMGNAAYLTMRRSGVGYQPARRRNYAGFA